MIVVTMGLSIAFVVPNIYGQVAMAAVGACTVTFLARLPSRY
jgi:hypothetical protein